MDKLTPILGTVAGGTAVAAVTSLSSVATTVPEVQTYTTLVKDLGLPAAMVGALMYFIWNFGNKALAVFDAGFAKLESGMKAMAEERERSQKQIFDAWMEDKKTDAANNMAMAQEIRHLSTQFAISGIDIRKPVIIHGPNANEHQTPSTPVGFPGVVTPGNLRS